VKGTLVRMHGRAEVMSAWASSELEAEHCIVQGDEQGCSWEFNAVKPSLGSSESCSTLPVTALHCCL